MSSVRRREAEHILRLCLNDHLRAFELLERQLNVLVLRSQVMLSLSGIVITVTGFSGRAIASTSPLAQLCIAGGILIVLCSAAVAILGVLRLRWLTQELDDEPIVTLLRGLEVRDRKAKSLRAASVLFVLGFALYCVAIAQHLLARLPPG